MRMSGRQHDESNSFIPHVERLNNQARNWGASRKNEKSTHNWKGAIPLGGMVGS